MKAFLLAVFAAGLWQVGVQEASAQVSSVRTQRSAHSSGYSSTYSQRKQTYENQKHRSNLIQGSSDYGTVGSGADRSVFGASRRQNFDGVAAPSTPRFHRPEQQKFQQTEPEKPKRKPFWAFIFSSD